MEINHKAMAIQWTVVTLCFGLVHGATVHTSLPFNTLVPESLCQLDHHSNSYQPKERRFDTSLTLELKPSSYTGPCKQLLEAPPSHGLYIRIYPITTAAGGDRPPRQEFHSISGTRSAKNMNVDSKNSTSSGSCPLTIYEPSNKSASPWRIDPCKMNGAEEARLLTSPLRIVWQHGQNWPNYKLTVTAYGEGEVCNQEGRHPCLKIGRQNLVCIREELLCDEVQNCPSGKEFESDESAAACELVKKKQPWMEFIKDVLKGFPALRSHGNGTSTEGGMAALALSKRLSQHSGSMDYADHHHHHDELRLPVDIDVERLSSHSHTETAV